MPRKNSTPLRSIDFERREDRYIVFIRDTDDLVQALGRYTKTLPYPDTPITRTVYFGDKARGLPPGLSIKARTYGKERLGGRWELSPKSAFQLLELKRTVKAKDIKTTIKQFKKVVKPTTDQMVEILRLSGSILAKSSYKSKQRKSKIRLGELLEIIGDPIGRRSTIEPQLYVHLLETVHPLEDFKWLPIIGTEYERTHFVMRSQRRQKLFRATLDKRVTHYAFYPKDGGYYGVPVGTEPFSRFEVKADHERLAGTAVHEWLEDILVRFRAFRIPSKKYRGLTLRSEYQRLRAGLQNELPGRHLYARFQSKPVRYKDHEHYVNLARFIQGSRTFHLYQDQPALLESHEHAVVGTHKKLTAKIIGSEIRYGRGPQLISEEPVCIYDDDAVPVARIPLTAHAELDEFGVGNMKKRSTEYVRARGFLVEQRKTGRVYYVGLERRSVDETDSTFFVTITYEGRSRGRLVFDKTAIVKDIQKLYRFLRKNPLLDDV